jgi:hypothetical protein
LHSVNEIQFKKPCSKYYPNSFIYDYLSNGVYPVSKFKTEYALPVNYKTPGYYKINPSTGKLLPYQRYPIYASNLFTEVYNYFTGY